MALAGYGVLIGTMVSSHRDTPDDQGRWFHVNLDVTAAGKAYRAAVDVDAKQSAVGVEWKTVALSAADLGPVPALIEGYHDLAMTPTSGAIDLVRSAWLRPSPGCLSMLVPRAVRRRVQAFNRVVPPWTQGSNLDAATALEALLVGHPQVLIYGQPFTVGLGMHNVHQNQSDPTDSQWAAENGIWQDGATIVRKADGTLSAFVSKFTSQAYATDDHGHPA